MLTYLVERYWPGVTSELFLEALDRGHRVIEQVNAERAPSHEISCILTLGKEVVFSVYDGPSAAAVSQFDERADIPVSRTVEVITVTPV